MVEDKGTGSFLAVWGREENTLACFSVDLQNFLTHTKGSSMTVT